MHESLTIKSYTPGEVAAICEVTPTTVYRWIMDGAFKGAFKLHGRWRVPEKCLDQIIELAVKVDKV
jgi:predicted site-specific integrase-resolvase